MSERAYGQQDPQWEREEQSAAASARDSMADKWSQGEIARIRRGESPPMYGPGASPPGAEARGGLLDFLNSLLGGT